MQMRFTSDVATARLRAASAPSGERESEAGVTFPANEMQNPGRRERSGKTWSSVTLDDESLPGSKGFPISLNSALIVIPRTRVESEMAVPLNAITSLADSFQLANDALMVGEVVSNICYRYSLRLLFTRSLIQKFARREVPEHGGRYIEKTCVSIEHEIKDVRAEKFARTGRT